MITREMRLPMTEPQVLNVLAKVDHHLIRFTRSWWGWGPSKNAHVLEPNKIVSPIHIKYLVGAGLVQPRVRGAVSWTYRITNLGKKLLDTQD